MKFDKYHPFISLLFFVCAITFAIIFNHPIFIFISYFCSFAYSIKLNGIKSLIFNIIILIFAVAYPFFYATYNHFGVTDLFENFVGNHITMESFIYGFVVSITLGSVIMWFSCFNAVFSSDKIIYLIGRISPKLSLYLSILLRTVPQINEKYHKVLIAQSCIGRGINKGNIFIRTKNYMRIISIVIMWMLENFIEKSLSMKNRGYKLKGKTTFSIYRFDNRDRSIITYMFLLITVILVGYALEQASILYKPQIIIFKPTYMSYIFYLVYFLFCFLPFLIEVINESKFRLAIKKCK